MSFADIQRAERNSAEYSIEPGTVPEWVTQALFVSAMHLPPPWLKGCTNVDPLDNVAERVFYKMILPRRTS